MKPIACHFCGEPIIVADDAGFLFYPEGIEAIYHKGCMVPILVQLDDDALAELSGLEMAQGELERRRKMSGYCGYKSATPEGFTAAMEVADDYPGDWEGAHKNEIASYVCDCLVGYEGPKKDQINFENWRRYLKDAVERFGLRPMKLLLLLIITISLTGCAGFRSQVSAVTVGGTVATDGQNVSGGFSTSFELRDPKGLAK